MSEHVGGRERAGTRAPNARAMSNSGRPAQLASGPAVLTHVELTLGRAEDLKNLRVRVGGEDPVPASFFFGLGSGGDEKADGGWADVTSVLHHVSAQDHSLATRLPIPLQAGESFSIEAADGSKADFRYRLAYSPAQARRAA